MAFGMNDIILYFFFLGNLTEIMINIERAIYFSEGFQKFKRAKWTIEQEAQLIEDVKRFLKINQARINIFWIEILKNNPIFKDKTAKQFSNKYSFLTQKKGGYHPVLIITNDSADGRVHPGLSQH